MSVRCNGLILRSLLLLFGLLASFGQGRGAVRLPAFFSDHMVLQREQEVALWGWCDPGEDITVTVDGQSFRGTGNRGGRWSINIGAWSAGGPHRIQIAGSNEITLSNVLFGDVWICAGQSNMDWALVGDLHAEKELPQADYPRIRLFKVPMEYSQRPQEDVSGSWSVCSPATAARFSAVAYYFGRDLYRNLDVPIGLIQASWGGSGVEAWMPVEAFDSLPAYEVDMVLLKSDADYVGLKRREFQEQRLMPWFHEFEEKSAPEFDDHTLNLSSIAADAWTDTYVPKLWERTALGDDDGLVWYKTQFETQPAFLKDERTVLHLGRLDDHDLVYLNGERIGYASWKELHRQYAIPDSLLYKDANELVVAVIDYGGEGGFQGEANDLFIESVQGEKTLRYPLPNQWKYYQDAFVPEIIPIWLGAIVEPTLLYNAMVAPFTRYSIKGAVWYQGEHRKYDPEGYDVLFKKLISGWRAQWQTGDFPFLFVQLPNYANEPGQYPEGNWAQLRQKQAAALALPNTGMAVTYDVGNPHDIHPLRKEPVGKRLALAARKVAYQQDVVASGPQLKEAVLQDSSIRLTFDPIGETLVVKDPYGYLKGFEVGYEENGGVSYQLVQAQVRGDAVLIKLEAGVIPKVIRYAWVDNPDGNLYNEAGLPAPQFQYWF